MTTVTATMLVDLIEFAPAASFTTARRIDTESGILYDVLLCGFESRNGYSYAPDALRNGAHLYEGKPCHCEHKRQSPTRGRFGEEVGHVHNPRFDPATGVRGDVHIAMRHPMAQRILETASREPQSFGMSHNAAGLVEVVGGKKVCTKLEIVRAVDFTQCPATAKNLYESGFHEPKPQDRSKGDALRDRLMRRRPLLESDSVTTRDAAMVAPKTIRDVGLKLKQILDTHDTADAKLSRIRAVVKLALSTSTH